MRNPIQWFNDTFVTRSIPVVQRMSDTQFTLQGTQRSATYGILSQSNVVEPYRVHAWVRAAIESVALNIAACPIMWKNSQGKLADPKREARKWTDLFEKPSDDMGLQQILEATMVYLLHYGECMWVLDRETPTSVPRAMYPYNGKLFEPVLSGDETKLIRWKVKTKRDNREVEITFEKSEVVFFRLFNPYDRWRGLAPLEAAQIGIDQDYLASQYNKAFFANSAMPGGVVEIDEEMSEESFNRLRTQFMDAHQGVSKAHMLAILEGGAKYKQLMVSQKDMEFLNQKKWNRDEVLACFKVPKMEVGVWDQVNFAAAKIQARDFWMKALMPKMRLIEYALWAQLFSVTGTGNIYMEFDTTKIEALQGDMVEKVDMARKFFEMGVPFGELNKRFGFNFETELPHWKTSYVISTVNEVDAAGKMQMPAIPTTPTDNRAKQQGDTNGPQAQ